jgi:hypothetical protein
VSDDRTCPECGTPFQRKRASAVFCCREHTEAFMNRKKVRGATLVELYMHHRYNRPAAKREGVLAKMHMLVAAWRQEDQRHGRQSMLDLDDVIERVRASAEAPEAR